MQSDLIVAATVHGADQADTQTLAETRITAQVNLVLADSETAVREAVADKGYHSAEALTWCEEAGVRTYIPERENRWERRWADKPEIHKKAVYGNRRRVRGVRGKRLGRRRSEYVERSFAHICETGGARRSWLRGLVNVTKRYLMYVSARNLGVIMRSLFGIGTPRSLQASGGPSAALVFGLWMTFCATLRSWMRHAALRAYVALRDIPRPINLEAA